MGLGGYSVKIARGQNNGTIGTELAELLISIFDPPPKFWFQIHPKGYVILA